MVDNNETTLKKRLTELREEQKKGQAMLVNLESEANELRAQLLRISGAIEVLEELDESTD